MFRLIYYAFLKILFQEFICIEHRKIQIYIHILGGIPAMTPVLDQTLL
jgi:hypothetical protein